MREAARLTGLAVLEAMRSTAPGVMEYELGALAEFVFRRGGAFGSAYEPIVAAGDEHLARALRRQDLELETGQLVLMDAAPDYRYYTSDIGRIWPVAGTWEPWQLELYGFIARYHVELLARIRPGATAEDVLAGAADAMRARARGDARSRSRHTSRLRAKHSTSRTTSRTRSACPSTTSASTGTGPLVPGHVFSVDPMLWVPDERLYIRCEDTVAVTEDGIENLTGFVPIDPDEIAACHASRAPASFDAG